MPSDPIIELENTWIPMADGTRLAARIWVPAGAPQHPVPAVLEYLPYRKSDGTAVADRGRHPYFASRGYAAVRVDIRGSGDSEGLLRGEYLPQEQDDALEVLAWLARQPWCDGAVGMIGYSWGGFNGLQVAARRPPQLKAVITIASTDDRYLDDCHYMGGCLLGSDMLKWASSMLTYTLQPPSPRLFGEGWREAWLHRLREAPELARDWVSHQKRDGFWRHGSVAEDYGAIECPVLVVGGWADAYTNAVPRLLAGLQVPRLGLIGPWGHMMPYEGVPGPAMDFLDEAVRWWDRWLKGIDNGIMEEPFLRAWIQEHVAPATFYAERPGRWVAEPSWPPPTVEPRPWVLGAAGRLEGRPLEEPGSEAAFCDDDHPGYHAPAAHLAEAARGMVEVSIRGAETCGETAGVWCANGGADEMAGDQAPDDALSLCFDTEPLETPVEVLGFPELRLVLRADRPLALVAARLEEVAPDGSSLLVSWGMLNLTHREGHEQPVPMEPGRRYEARLQTRVCGHRFSAGNRIRLALTPTYWPHAWPSPELVTLSVAVDGPSVLELPVREAPASERQVAMRPAPVPPPPAAGPERRDERRRRVRVDAVTGAHEIRDDEEHSRVVPGTGTRYTERSTDIYSIDEERPLSARVRCERETTSEGPEGYWRVTLASEMWCDADSFFIEEQYAAFDGGRPVFERRRRYTVPRDGV